MILDLRPYEEFPVSVKISFEKPGFSLDREDVSEINSVSVDFSVQHSDEEYFCQGTVSGEVILECARCLKHYKTDVSGKTDFIIRGYSEVDADLKDIPDDEEYAEMVENKQADITAIARQTIGLAIPIKPVCKPECRGLCSQCGVNLNDKTCDCKTEQIDERWEGLRGLSQK